jgi:hypothetical protein
MTKPKSRGRKTSSRSKGWFKRPDQAARLKALWADPEYRERMTKQLADNTGSRTGVPDGMRKRTITRIKKKAEQAADRFIQMLKDEGDLPLVTVPDTEAGMAEAALKQAFLLAVLPGDKKVQISAINTVLNFTKAKPESKSKVTVESAEDWLKAAQEDMKNSD